MKLSQGRRVFSLNYLFASFFGAALIAGAFAYSNYRFSEYKFINFTEWIFYTKSDVFIPKSDTYTIVIYSSNMQDFQTIHKRLKTDNPILAIDMFQQKRGLEDGVLYLFAGMNTLLKVVQRFNVYEVPSAFRVKKFNETLYKQDSLIEIIE
jgi:hypothetical protein